MRIVYVGNFIPSHSTENHVRQALTNLGHSVFVVQESDCLWDALPDACKLADLFLWTRTAGYDPPDRDRQRLAIKAIPVPTVGFHLDRWWGLKRESNEGGPASSDPSPFFAVDYLFTADGGHADRWQEYGINHYWSPPGILSSECELGTWRKDYAADVGFVGNLRRYGHLEWQGYRQALLRFLATVYRGRFKLWEGGIRGRDLADLYQSVKILIGDSCLAGNGPTLPGGSRGGATHYCSDRIPETLGRGGFLIHPRVEGITNHVYREGEHLAAFDLGDFDQLRRKIDFYLNDERERLLMVERGRQHVLSLHTYESRLAEILSIVQG